MENDDSFIEIDKIETNSFVEQKKENKCEEKIK